MHERLMYGLFAPFPTMLTLTSCLYHSFFFPWYSKISEAQAVG